MSNVALVAVGGYGRSELFPASDLDLVLLHERGDEIAGIADRLWYPIWDAGAELGHSVRTVSQALALARHDLDTATSLLSARHVAGDESMSAALAHARRPPVGAWREALAGHCSPTVSMCDTSAPARSPSCSSPISRTAVVACATCTPWDGRRRRVACCSRTTTARSPTRTASWSLHASSCSAGPAVRATNSRCRIKTRSPRRSAMSTRMR